MLKKLFFKNHINSFSIGRSINFFKCANFSRKISNPDKKIANLDKSIINSLKRNEKCNVLNTKSNYVDIERIQSLNDPQLFEINKKRNAAKTKEVSKDTIEDALGDKNINIIKEDVFVDIKPYFPKAVSEKEKSHSHIDSSKLDTGTKSKKSSSLGANSLEILKNKRIDKRKIAASRKAALFMQTIKRELPEDFYRMGLTGEVMDQHSDLVKRAMSLNNASVGEFHQARMLHVRKLFSKHERDTASPAITACALCEKIIRLISHIKKSKKDTTAIIKLQKFLTQRRKYMLYLKRTDFNSYSYIIKYYGMKDYDDSMHKSFKKMPNLCKTTYERSKKTIL